MTFLPNLIIFKIVTYLNLTDCYNFRCSSKRFNDIAKPKFTYLIDTLDKNFINPYSKASLYNNYNSSQYKVWSYFKKVLIDRRDYLGIKYIKTKNIDFYKLYPHFDGAILLTGDLKLIKSLISKENVRPFCVLIFKYGKVEVAQYYLSILNHQYLDPYWLNKNIAFASETNNWEMIHFLIQCGANDFNYAMRSASHFENWDMVKFYAGKGAFDFNFVIKSASKFDNLEMVKYCVERGAWDFFPALKIAQQKGYYEITNYLLSLLSQEDLNMYLNMQINN